MLAETFFLSPGYPLRSLVQLIAQSPSREHGLSVEQERAMIRTATNMIIGAGQKLQMDHLAIATAVVYLQRFYAIKSLLTNDYFVISIACLYLAGKVEDSPKSVRDVLYACFEWRYKGRQEVMRRLYDKDFYEPAKERVFTAERALMYALGFEFNVHHVIVELIKIFQDGHSPITQLWNSLMQADTDKAHSIVQSAYSLANDSLKTPLCLQYRADQIAAGVLCMLLSLYRLEVDTLDPRTGQPWWASYHLTPEALEDITAQMLRLYEPHQQPGGNAAAQQFTDSGRVWQGAQEGQLLLYGTHLMSAEQQKKAHPPPQQQPPQQQHAPPAATPAPPSTAPPVQPPAQPQPQQAPAVGAAPLPPPQLEALSQAAPADEEDEYAELFA